MKVAALAIVASLAVEHWRQVEESMPRARTLSPPLRIAVGLIGVVLLLLAGLCAIALYEGPWNWWIASFGILALLEAIDFLVAALRRGGGWPTPAFFLVDLLTPW